MARAAVVGGGAVGGYLAALLHDAGHDVELCVRTPIAGLTIEQGGAAREVPVQITSDPASVAPADWVVVAVKVPDTDGTSPWLDALATADSTVVVAQNSLRHVERVAPLVATSQILPALVTISVEPLAPGRIRHSAGRDITVPKADFGFGELLGAADVDVTRVGDFHTAAWLKLLGNVVGNPITALTQRRVEVLKQDSTRGLVVRLLEEAAAVGRADGAALTQEHVDAALAFIARLPDDNGSSMYYDRMAGRPLEHEALTGLVCRLGAAHGVPTPTHDTLLALLRALPPVQKRV